MRKLIGIALLSGACYLLGNWHGTIQADAKVRRVTQSLSNCQTAAHDPPLILFSPR